MPHKPEPKLTKLDTDLEAYGGDGWLHKRRKLAVTKSDRLPGGRADKKKPSDFDADALAAGTAHEMEHTNDRKLAREIAMDHLAEDAAYYVKLKKIEKGDKKPCSRCGGLAYNDSRMGLGDCCIDKALPKKDRSGEGGAKKTPSKKASSKQAGKTGKTRYNYPQDKAPEPKAKHTPGQPDPVKHQEPTQHRADPQELANQLQIPMATLKSIAERFKDNTKLGGRKGFAKFMLSQLKKVTEKHRLDGDYFGLIYDALVGASPSL